MIAHASEFSGDDRPGVLAIAPVRPNWIQSDETPSCCGRPMVFCFEVDAHDLCEHRPADVKLWWHDYAVFYVFTCGRCLEVKAVGQQM